MAVTNRAIVIHGAEDVRVEERPEPEPGPNQVQVEVELGGICGSDISYYRNGAVGDFRVKRPMILGHEVIGRVREIGAGTSGSVQGARVAVDPSSPCLRCERCKEGRPNVCLNPVFLGSASTDPHVDGGFADLIVTGTANLVPVADDLGGDDLVFAEPLAVTVHALNRAGDITDRKILVVGAGPIGAILSAAARRAGAGHIAVSDLDPTRLALVKSMGADRTLVAGQDEPDDDYDAVFECSGAGPGIEAALQATRKGGTLVLVGLPHGGPVAVPLGLSVAREMAIMGSFRFCHDEFVEAVDLLSTGLDLSPLRSDSYAAEDAHAAFRTACSPGSMKVQVAFGAHR